MYVTEAVVASQVSTAEPRLARLLLQAVIRVDVLASVPLASTAVLTSAGRPVTVVTAPVDVLISASL